VKRNLATVLTIAALVGLSIVSVSAARNLGVFDAYQGLGLSWMAMFGPVRARLLRWFTRTPTSGDVAADDAFHSSWWVLLLSVTLVLLVVLQVLGAAATFVYITAGGVEEHLIAALSVAAVVGYPIAVYSAGRYMGVRARRLAWLAVIIAAVAAQVLGVVLGYLILGAEELAAVVGADLAIATAAVGPGLQGLVVGATAGILGVWRGRRSRNGTYLAYLLSRTAPAHRAQIMDWVRQATRPAPSAVKHLNTPQS
jgi:hypothetical protein